MKEIWEKVEAAATRYRHAADPYHSDNVTYINRDLYDDPNTIGGSFTSMCGLTGLCRSKIWFGSQGVTCPDCRRLQK